MSHIFITRRVTLKRERRYVVRYRWGGRAYELIHLGSKRTEREARVLRDWGAGELAAGRDPRKELRRKSKRGKWVPVPLWLMDVITETCPVEDRLAGVAVFRGVTDDQLRRAMASACKLAGIPSYSPHDLRDRRITLWHYAGVPLREIQERVGHSWASTTLDTYTHVMPVDELSETALLAVLDARGEVLVRS